MFQKINRFVKFSSFIFFEGKLSLDVLKIWVAWIFLQGTSMFPFLSKITSRNKLKRFNLQLTLKGYSIDCRTGHAGLIEELFVYRNKLPLGSGDIIDCGANIGLFLFSLLLMGADPKKVVCVEPDPRNLSLLKKNIEKNAISLKMVLPVAIAATDSVVNFVSTENGVGSCIKDSSNQTTEEKISVNSRSIDSIVFQNNLKPSFIKIDVEGFEIETLKGASKTLKKYQPRLLIEIHKEEYYEEAIKLLKEINYKVFKPLFGDSLLCTV